jgi:4-methyl-5(b-hydroxyethyl)-thiazole monophosphate biosynthesis
MAPRALVVIAPGSEDLETAVVTDVLVRGKVDVVLAAAGPDVSDDGLVVMSRGLRIAVTHRASNVCEGLAQGTENFAAVVFPGGMPGAKAVGDDPAVQKCLAAIRQRGGVLVGAICAAPVFVLGPAQMLPPTATCFPALQHKLPTGVVYSASRVVETDAVVLSQGPGTSFDFALALLRRLQGEPTRAAVARQLLVPDTTGQLLPSKL